MKNAVADWQLFKHVRFCIYIIVNKNRNHFFPLRWKFPSSNPMKIKKNGTKRGLRIVHDTDWMGHYHINEGNMWGDG